MYRSTLFLSAIFAAFSVAIGAFGAHALESILSEKLHKTYETAVRYQMYHSIALCICGILLYIKPNRLFNIASNLFVLGIILFSGSLYLLIFFQLKQMSNFNFIGAVTPLGGICFISGWICLALGTKKM